jgi:homogentisate phytyltransferase / homogentisate geranylgeranyltransferase
LSIIGFGRPHTLIATTMNIILLHFYTSKFYPEKIVLGKSIVLLVSLLAFNVAVVGLNQVYDLEVDKISKPYLPLASGSMKMNDAYVIIAFASLCSFIFLLVYPSAISLWLLMAIAYLIGISYSIPYFKVRNSTFWPIVIIVSCRAIFFNLITFKYLSNIWTDSFLILWIEFKTLYVLAIAIFKDIPDLNADILFNRKSVVGYLGENITKSISCGLLITAFFLLRPAGFFVAFILSGYLLYQFLFRIGLSEYELYKVRFTEL